MFQRFVKGFVELLAPPTCAACDERLVEPRAGFCGACLPLLERAERDADDGVRVAYVFGGPLADAIHRLKYEGALWHVRTLANLLVPLAAELEGQVDVVTAVPLHPRKLRERGYNQSALLAARLARVLDVPFKPSLLERTRAASRQVGQGRSRRAQQVKRAFQASPRVGGQRVLVVDDVRTSGATLDEIRRVLFDRGARDALLVALAQTPEADG